jgi:hypothetical protein
MEIDTGYLARLDAARDLLIELRRDLRIMKENINQLEAPGDRYEEKSHLSFVLRRLHTCITSLAGSISATITHQAKKAGMSTSKPSMPQPPGPFIRRRKP